MALSAYIKKTVSILPVRLRIRIASCSVYRMIEDAFVRDLRMQCSLRLIFVSPPEGSEHVT